MKLKNKIILTIIIIIFMLVLFSNNIDNLKEENFFYCEQNNDCIAITDGCCGCNMGGKMISINKNHQDRWNNNIDKDCKGIFCLTVISQHPSCFSTPKCIENKCELIEN